MAKQARHAKRPNSKANETEYSGIIEIEEAQRRRQQKREEAIKESRLKEKKEKKQKKQSKKERPKMSPEKKIAALCVVVVVFVVFGISGMQLMGLHNEKAKVEAEYQERLAEKESLEKEFSMVNDPEYIESQARDRFRMLKTGEILYVFPSQDTDNSQ